MLLIRKVGADAALIALTLAGGQAAPAPKPFWRAEGGSVRAERIDDGSRLTGSGWIRTSRVFLDQRIELDYRVGQEDAEGSLIVRGVVPRPGDRPTSGYRIALTPTRRRLPGEIQPISTKPTRAEFHAPQNFSNGWQHLEVTASGEEVVTKLNGQLISTVVAREHEAGYVGLEVKQGSMDFRRVSVAAIGSDSCAGASARDSSSARADGERVSPPLKPGDGVQLPRVIRQQKPHYTVEAMADRTQGVVWVDAVVKTDGTVGNVCVTKSLHPDLDAEALAAARQWRFKPGTRDGVAVNVLVTIELTFTLR